jgi:hypothetical protein
MKLPFLLIKKMKRFFLMKLKKEIIEKNTVNKIEDDFSVENDEDDTKSLNQSFTHLEAFKYVSALEDYFLIHNPENLNYIYNLKKILSSTKSKRNPSMFDYLTRSGN